MEYSRFFCSVNVYKQELSDQNKLALGVSISPMLTVMIVESWILSDSDMLFSTFKFLSTLRDSTVIIVAIVKF